MQHFKLWLREGAFLCWFMHVYLRVHIQNHAKTCSVGQHKHTDLPLFEAAKT